MPDKFDPLFGKPPCPYAQEDCLPGCEHGYAGPCERKKFLYRPPGESSPVNDNVDDRIEEAMATLERSVEEVTETIEEFRGSMRKLGRALNFLFWIFVLTGGCVIVLAVARLF
jgi:hypothetical protein